MHMAGLGRDRSNQGSVGFLFSDGEEVVLRAMVSMLHCKVDQFLGHWIVMAVRRRVRALEVRVDFVPCQNTALFQRVCVQFEDLIE